MAAPDAVHQPPARARRDGDDAVASVLVASRALLGVVAASLAPVLERVTLPQFRVLVLLSTLGPCRTGMLAERLGVHQSTFTRTADRLVEAGYITRVDNPRSRREVLVDLSPEGRRLVRSVSGRRERAVRRILGGLDEQQRAAVISGMQTFAEAAGEPEGDPLLILGL